MICFTSYTTFIIIIADKYHIAAFLSKQEERIINIKRLTFTIFIYIMITLKHHLYRHY